MNGTRTALPLEGRNIVVTRAQEQAGALVDRLRALGAFPVECPAISIEPLHDFSQLDAAINRLSEYDWVVFTSVNGVEMFASRLADLGVDIEMLRRRRLAAIGPATADALGALGCAPDFVPGSYVAEAILAEIGDVSGCRMLLPRADIARKALVEGLVAAGAQVDEVAAYRTVRGEGSSELAAMLREGTVHAVTFTSSSTVRNTVEALLDAGLLQQEAVALLNSTAVVCIGPITERTAEEYGLRVAAVAREYTINGLVDALVDFFSVRQEG